MLETWCWKLLRKKPKPATQEPFEQLWASLIVKLHVALWQEQRLLCQKRGGNTETASPDLRQAKVTHSTSSTRLKMQALSWLAAQETHLLRATGKFFVASKKSRSPEQSPAWAAAVVLRANCLRTTLWWWLNSSTCVKKPLFLPTKCPARQQLSWDTDCPSRTTGYHHRQGQPTGKPLQTKLLTSLLVIPPAQTLGAISSMSQVPISFAFEAQNFHSSSPEGKTGRSIFSQALLKLSGICGSIAH